jgi:hypothetical protein
MMVCREQRCGSSHRAAHAPTAGLEAGLLHVEMIILMGDSSLAGIVVTETTNNGNWRG